MSNAICSVSSDKSVKIVNALAARCVDPYARFRSLRLGRRPFELALTVPGEPPRVCSVHLSAVSLAAFNTENNHLQVKIEDDTGTIPLSIWVNETGPHLVRTFPLYVNRLLSRSQVVSAA